MEFSVTWGSLDSASASTARVAVSGEIDMSTGDQITSAIRDAILEDKPSRLIVDVHDVRFMDSQGVRALINGYHLAQRAGVAYVVVNATDMIRTVLEVTGVWTVLCEESASPSAESHSPEFNHRRRS